MSEQTHSTDGRMSSPSNARAFLLGGALATVILAIPTVAWDVQWPVGLESALSGIIATAIAWFMPKDMLMKVPTRPKDQQ